MKQSGLRQSYWVATRLFDVQGEVLQVDLVLEQCLIGSNLLVVRAKLYTHTRSADVRAHALVAGFQVSTQSPIQERF